MNKKLLIAIGVVVVLFAGVGLWLILSGQKPAPLTPPNSYAMSVTEQSGTINASFAANNKVTLLTAQDLANFAVITFNSPHDILWVECPAGYTLSNPYSPTKNKVTNDPILQGSNIELKAGAQNTLQVTCSK